MLLVMRYISSKDHVLAQKYRLGTPIRKYRFHPIHSSYMNPFSSFVRVITIWLLSMVSIGAGLYLDISITVEVHVGWMWPWILAAASVPIMFGMIAYRMGYKRLARLNGAATIVSIFLVTLCNSFFFLQNLP